MLLNCSCMKPKSLASLIWLAIGFHCWAAENPTGEKNVRILLDHWPPYHFRQYPDKGIIYPIVKRAFQHSGYQTEIVTAPAPRKKAMLIADSLADLDCSVWFSQSRARILTYSTPFMFNRYALYAMANKGISSLKTDQLRLGIIRGFEYLQPPEFISSYGTVTKVRDSEILLKMLLSHRIDVGLLDQRVVQWSQRQHHQEYLQIDKPLFSRELHCVAAKENPRGATLIAAFNAGLLATQNPSQ